MDLSQVLELFSRQRKLPALKVDKYGICTIRLNDRFIISCEEGIDEKDIFLYSIVNIETPDNDRQLALEVLEGNLFGKETGNCCIGYDSMTKSYILFRRLHKENLTIKEFENGLNEMIAYLTYWEAKQKARL